MTELEQLKIDLLFLAKRAVIIEDAVIRIEDALIEFNKAIGEWSEFLNKEMFRQGIRIHKNKRSFEFFRSSLRETHKEHYEKFEDVFKKVRQLFDKRKEPTTKYNKYIS